MLRLLPSRGSTISTRLVQRVNRAACGAVVACQLAAFSERATKRGMTIRDFRIQTHAVHEPHPIRHILDLDISSRSEVSFHAVFECDARVFDMHRVQCIDFTTWCWQADGRFIGHGRNIGHRGRGAAARSTQGDDRGG
jgi:hypothetical protein